jgi:hypothetical protein
MATLISADDVRARFDIDPDILDARLDSHIGSASRRLRRWVGDSAYADALEGTPTDADRKVDLQNAEAHLAFHYAVYGLNYVLSSKGIVATAMSAEGKEMRKYLTPAETQAVANQMLEVAREIAEPYSIIDAVPGSSWLAEEQDS